MVCMAGPPGQCVLRRGCLWAKAEHKPESRVLGLGEKLNQSLANKHLFCLEEQFSQSFRTQNGMWGVCFWLCHR